MNRFKRIAVTIASLLAATSFFTLLSIIESVPTHVGVMLSALLWLVLITLVVVDRREQMRQRVRWDIVTVNYDPPRGRRVSSPIFDQDDYKGEN